MEGFIVFSPPYFCGMYTIIEVENWKRRDAFRFFKDFDDPFFNVTAPVDVTGLLEQCRQENSSFFLQSLHLATMVANQLDAFRFRLLNDAVVCYDLVHCGSAVLLPDHTFRYCYFDYTPDRLAFEAAGAQAIQKVMAGTPLDPRNDALNMLHFSVLPWIPFTAFKHARRFSKTDSIPKIMFGKYYREADRWLMPVSVEVNHALMDGYEVGLYFEALSAAAAR